MGALGGIRTPNLLIRSQMLCPLSYERRPSGAAHECTGWAPLASVDDLVHLRQEDPQGDVDELAGTDQPEEDEEDAYETAAEAETVREAGANTGDDLAAARANELAHLMPLH